MTRPVRRIAIVGGGLAGVITGLELLKGKHAGAYDITVFERAAAPYTTLCGEGLSHTTLSRFTAFDSFPYAAETFKGAAWWFPGGLRVDVDETCYTMARERWIPAMAEAFQKAGGEYRTNAKVSAEDVPALARDYDLVIGADGPGSQVRKHVGGAHTTMLGIQYRVEKAGYETDRLEFYTDKRWSPEYAWVFPRGDILNVGLLADDRVTAEENWRRLDLFMQERKVEGKVVKREAYPIGFFGDKLQRDNVLLLGDAAGLTNPVTKGGMAAVIYAAEILADLLKRGRVEAYERAIFAHPITDPSFRRAVEIIHRWSNEDFEAYTRFAPKVLTVDGKVATKKRYFGPLVKTFLRYPHRIRDFEALARAFGVSRVYSW
ncbi:MAG TPA: NAD(P)/FAD-dependent oxidoreductase [Candidatus Thermoplasmatota archaeon]|nr:NAD(P)/FAD-dependent oxidoreductase [Candidatus Thermoplasmatota archaeon]